MEEQAHILNQPYAALARGFRRPTLTWFTGDSVYYEQFGDTLLESNRRAQQ
jgi:hypothetical protein